MPVAQNRRRFLVGTGCVAAGIAAGCRPGVGPSGKRQETGPRVPLNLVVALPQRSDPSAARESLQQAWAAVSDHALQVSVVPYDEADPSAGAAAFAAAADRSDLILYPLVWAADLSQAGKLVPLGDDLLAEIVSTQGKLFPALQSGAAYEGNRALGIPVAAVQPALVSIDRLPTVETWEQYDRWVAEDCEGHAAEPTAAGWAGPMFLWRAMTNRRWLFDRDSFEPLIGEAHYVEALQLFVQTHNRYRAQRQTPDQIWSGVATGKLRGGIGWPSGSGPQPSLQVGDVPGIQQPNKILLNPFTPMISLSAACRQSAHAKRWLVWMAGGEGSAAARRQLFGGSGTRTSSDVAGSIEAMADGYHQWLTRRLDQPLTLPTLQLPQSSKYLAALDAHVGSALDGDLSPQDALRRAADQWRAVSREIGIDAQRRAWRGAQPW